MSKGVDFNMNRVIRIRDQKVFDSISAAAKSIGTQYNYLAQCIRDYKPCKGEYFEFYRGEGQNSDTGNQVMKEVKLTDRLETMYQQIFSIMLKRAKAEGMPLDEVYHRFVRDTESRFERD